MSSVNKAIILGNVGKDPEIRYMADGKAAASLSVATSSSWKNKDGEKQESTEWHRISAFGKLAEIIGEYVKKGSHIYIEGRITTRKWKDKEGQDKYTTEIIADQMQMLGGKREEVMPASQMGLVNKKVPAVAFDDMQDDIPF